MFLKKMLPLGVMSLGCSGAGQAPVQAPVQAPEAAYVPAAPAAPAPAAPAPAPAAPAPAPAAPALELVAVVEDGHAWVRTDCQFGQPLTPEQSAPPSWSSQPLLLLSGGGLRPVQPGPAVCLQGACNGSQVGLPVGEGAGVLLRAEPAPPAFGPLRQLEEGAPDCPELPYTDEPDAPVEECDTYVLTGDGARALQVHGSGSMQENQWPFYGTIEARLLERNGTSWTFGPWISLDRRDVALPVPIAQTSGPEPQIVWMSSVLGESSAWTGTLTQKGWIKGASVEGGFAQGCD